MNLPASDTLAWLVTRYAALVAEHGEAIGTPRLVLPNAEFFPDEFVRDGESVVRLFRRMLSYAPVADDLPVELRIIEPDAEQGGGKACGSGSCGTSGSAGPRNPLLEHEEGYAIELATSDVGHPVLLTTAFARSAGALVLAEAEADVKPEARDAMSEIAAVFAGYGVLLANGSSVFSKSCGGVRMHRATTLELEELTVLLALFLRHRGMKIDRARGSLEATQREAFDAAVAWVDSNKEVVQALHDHPATLAEGLFTLRPTQGFFARLFAKGSSRPLADAPSLDVRAPEKKRRVRSPEEQRILDEARALVDEALGDG